MIALELIFVVNVAQKACFFIFFNLRGPYLTPFISFCFTRYDDVRVGGMVQSTEGVRTQISSLWQLPELFTLFAFKTYSSSFLSLVFFKRGVG